MGQSTIRDVSLQDLEQILDEDTLDELTQKTNMSRTELLSRLSRELLKAVDQYTRDGRIPYQCALRD